MQGPTYPPGSPGQTPQFAPSQEERVMAALAHASILVHQVGIIAPLVLWLVNEGKAPYAAYQAKQAFFFHLLVTVVTWIAVGLGFAFGLLTFGIGLFLAIPILSALPVAHDLWNCGRDSRLQRSRFSILDRRRLVQAITTFIWHRADAD